MPELPEVETIRRGLEKHLVRCVIEGVEVRLSRIFTGDVNYVIGAGVVGVRRFGKGLVIDLDNGYSLVVHVKMTGQLVFGDPVVEGRSVGKLPNKWTHVIFKLKNPSKELKVKEKSYLFYNDIRQFGWVRVIKTSELKAQSYFKGLGAEPLMDLSLEVFEEIASKTRTPIKLLLMDQGRIAGIGNIYANDALYAAGIDPRRPSLSLSRKEIKVLFEAIEVVLKKGIEVGGASEWNYVNALGERGGYQNFFQVYRKSMCGKCGGDIKRVKMGGRGTFFCVVCQV